MRKNREAKMQDAPSRKVKESPICYIIVGLVALTSAALGEQEAALLHDSLGNPDLSDQQVERIRELMVSSGAFAEHERLIEQKSRAVFEALDALELDELVRAALSDIVDRALRRKS